jgi:hypothetical protein
VTRFEIGKRRSMQQQLTLWGPKSELHSSAMSKSAPGEPQESGVTVVLPDARSVGSSPLDQNQTRTPFPVEPRLRSIANVPPPALFKVEPHDEDESSLRQPGSPVAYAEQLVYCTVPVSALIVEGMVQLVLV